MEIDKVLGCCFFCVESCCRVCPSVLLSLIETALIKKKTSPVAENEFPIERKTLGGLIRTLENSDDPLN